MSRVLEDGYTLDDALRAVGPGWAGILREFWPAIPTGTIIVQVKEKFGGLRIYHEPRFYPDGEYPPDDPAFEVALDKAEQAAGHTCEQCGAPGETVERHGWYKTLCAGCWP